MLPVSEIDQSAINGAKPPNFVAVRAYETPTPMERLAVGNSSANRAGPGPEYRAMATPKASCTRSVPTRLWNATTSQNAGNAKAMTVRHDILRNDRRPYLSEAAPTTGISNAIEMSVIAFDHAACAELMWACVRANIGK